MYIEDACYGNTSLTYIQTGDGCHVLMLKGNWSRIDDNNVWAGWDV